MTGREEALMAETTVIEWDGTGFPAELRKLLPAELRDLPPGRYAVEPLLDDELTPEEEAGILEAIAEIDAGKGVSWEEVVRDLRTRAQRR